MKLRNKTILLSDNTLWSCLNFREYIINKFVDQGYHVVIVAPNDNFVEVDIPTNITYEPIEMKRTGSNPIKDFMYMIRLRAIYQKYKPFVIFHYTIKPNIYGTFAAKTLGIPSVAVVTGLGYVFANRGIICKIAHSLYRKALSFAQYVVFLNNDNYQLMLSREMVRISNSIVLTGGEGINIKCVEATPLSQIGQTYFLMIARVLYDKGYTEFVEAAKANPIAQFQLIGAIDINPQAVPPDIVKNETAIEYLGFIPRDKVFDYINKCSCVVLPSYHEGMSVTLTEAIAMGRPVICSDIAGCREMVDDGVNGYLVPPKDCKALAAACAKFIALSSEQKEEMARHSRRKAECQFDIENVWTVYQNIINNIKSLEYAR